MVEKYMKNLRESILKTMEEGNYTIARFADECGVSEREISKIKNGDASNIRFDTLVKICENSGIHYEEIFDLCNTDYAGLEVLLENILSMCKIQKFKPELFTEQYLN